MPRELEFDYPSADFFEQIETQAKELPLTSHEFAKLQIEQSGSLSRNISLSELLVRLKIEIAADFEMHEGEADDLPYFAAYLLVKATVEHTECLSVRTALKSKNGHLGRVLYGIDIYRTEDNSYVSESSYGD